MLSSIGALRLVVVLGTFGGPRKPAQNEGVIYRGQLRGVGDTKWTGYNSTRDPTFLYSTADPSSGYSWSFLGQFQMASSRMDGVNYRRRYGKQCQSHRRHVQGRPPGSYL